MGSLSDAHLRNSNDLITRLRDLDFSRKVMGSYDVTALFTNVSTEGALAAAKEVVDNMNDIDLPVGKADFLKLVSLCVRFGPFVFNGEEYSQKRGLAMGSPLSAVLASLYMEMLERDHFRRIMGRETHWFRFVDDVLVIAPEGTNLNVKLRDLNLVNNDIQFTVEHEVDKKLPFLDIMIRRKDNGTASFSVYRKATNKNDLIHYYSAHSDRIKSGVIIGFFLRAFRVCSEEHIDEEVNYIFKVFSDLGYPEGLIHRLRRKALKIRGRRTEDTKGNEEYITVPNSKYSGEIGHLLRKAGINVACSTGEKIGAIVRRKEGYRGVKVDDSVVYQIPCGNCDLSYFGETGRGLHTRTYEHRNDLKSHRTSNALVVHSDKYGHLPNWGMVKTLHKRLERRKRKIVEAAYISSYPCCNNRDGFIKLARTTSWLILQELRGKGGRDEVG